MGIVKEITRITNKFDKCIPFDESYNNGLYFVYDAGIRFMLDFGRWMENNNYKRDRKIKECYSNDKENYYSIPQLIEKYLESKK